MGVDIGRCGRRAEYRLPFDIARLEEHILLGQRIVYAGIKPIHGVCARAQRVEVVCISARDEIASHGRRGEDLQVQRVRNSTGVPAPAREERARLRCSRQADHFAGGHGGPIGIRDDGSVTRSTDPERKRVELEL